MAGAPARGAARRGRGWRRGAVVLLALGLSAACTPEQLAGVRAHLDAEEARLSSDALARLRECESGGDYDAVSSSGKYRGAYQFGQGTWNGVAQRNLPWLVGVDPADASPSEQDAMARRLFQESGRGPWPVCGRRI